MIAALGGHSVSVGHRLARYRTQQYALSPGGGSTAPMPKSGAALVLKPGARTQRVWSVSLVLSA